MRELYMISLLFNKKTAVILSLILPFIFSNYAIAGPDICVDSVEIEDRHTDNIYEPEDTFRVWVSFSNIGDEGSEDFVVDIYAGDYLIGSGPCDAFIQPGWDASFGPTCTIPSDISPGNYTVWAEILYDDDDPDNNTGSASPDIIIEEEPVPPPPPPVVDLDIYWVDTISSTGFDNVFFPGGEIRYVTRVKNLGNVTSESYDIYFSIGSYFIGSVSRSPLGPDEIDEYNGAETFSIPHDIPDGNYYVYGEVVCPNDIDLSNNEQRSTGRIKLITPYPDISILSINVNGRNFKPNESINIVTQIKNVGYLAAENIYVEYYAGEYNIGNKNRSSLDPDEVDSFIATCQFPENMPYGYYDIRAVVTCTDDNDSNNNEDNINNIWVGYNPDLEVQSVQATNGTYMPGDEINVYSLVKNIGDDESNAYTIDFYASTDAAITTHDYHIGYVERDGLASGEQDSYNTTCYLPLNIPATQCYIGVIVICLDEYNLSNNSGYDSDSVQCIHPANYICGHVSYAFPDYNNQVIKYALVKVCDGSSFLDGRLIRQTYTDHAGNYGLVVPVEELSTPYIRVHVLTQSGSGVYPGVISSMCNVMDEVFDQTYQYRTNSMTHPQGGSLIVNRTIPDDWRPFLVYDSMVQSFHKAKVFFGVEMEEINTYWPSEANASYYVPDVGIFISQDDEWDRDLIMHEYGHYIATVYDFAQGEVGDNPIHYWDYDLRYKPVDRTEEHASNLTFRESWPTLFSIAAQYGDKNYPHSGDTMYQDYYSYYDYLFQIDLEQDTFDNDSPGEYYENMNCCSLWDIFDDNRDRLSFQETVVDPGLVRIWTIMRDCSPKNIHEFWLGWYNRYFEEGDIEGVEWIFERHRMTFAESGELPPTPQNHAPVADAGEDQVVEQDRLGGALVRLNGNSSNDPDGDELGYTWRRHSEQYLGKNVQVLVPVGYATFELEVSDGEFKSWDTIEIHVIATDPGTW